MQCPRCRHDNPPQAKFCEECGRSLTQACANCQTEFSMTAKFCPECGRPVAAITVAQAAFASPRAYTPKHLAERILTSRSALEGERKQVTVLFCDIVDSFRLAERLDPEAMHEVMDRALRLMAEGVHRYEGTVNQFLGDGIMALFGAPLALEDHAFHAIQAALAIRETLGGYSEKLKKERGITIDLRLGLNTGLVVLGRIGDDLRMDYTAVGDTTHVAARLQALAEPGAVLITETTHRLVEGYVRSEPLGPVQVRGRSEQVRVFKVIGRRRARTRFEAMAERGLTPLIGRQRELALLHECLARARSGRGQVVGVAGDPGVGKSRLVYEFRRSLKEERITWLEGHCVGYGQTTPYLPILEILRTNFQIEEGDNPLQIREKLRQGVSQLDPTIEWIVPFLGELLGVPAEDEALKHLDPKERRQKIFEAIRALTVAGAQRRSHVVIVESLHWMDKTSEDYLAFLIESLPGMPLLLLTTHRPGYAVRWGDKTYYTQIALDLLTDQEAEMMAAAILGSHELPVELVRIIREKAEGNPLFVEEVTRSLLECGVLVRTNGRVRWAGGVAVEIPATLQDIIGARIDRLDEPIKRTVQTAAVIGREFGARLLVQIAEKPEEIQRHLDVLKRLELVHEKRFYPELEYTFKHALTQDVAYQSLLDQRQRQLHGAIGETIEKLYADRLEEQAAILAYHYGRSENQEKAIEYALLGGDRAARLFANQEASTYYEQALAIARALPASPQAQRWHIDATLKLAGVGVTRQDMERDWANLERARALAEELHDEPRLARILYWLGRIRYLYWEPQMAIEYATQSLETAERLGDEALAAPPVNLMGRVYWLLADYARAAPLVERSVEQMYRLGNKTEESTAAGIAGMTFGCMGQFGRAFAYADRGIRLAQQIQNPFAEAAAVLYRGWIRDQRGEWAGALADYQEATRIAQRAGDLFRLYIIKTWEGRGHTMAGDPAQGRTLLEESFALAEKIGTRFVLYFQKAWLAACLLELGELDTVIPLCQEAIQLADATGEKLTNAFARRTLAEAYARLEPSNPEKAERAILEAIRILEAIDARPELARTYASYALLLKTRGENDRAKERLAQAIGMFREMEMAWDLARAEQALRES